MIYSFYKQDTGEFITRKVRCPASSIDLNTPAGCVAVEGTYNPSSHIYDFNAGEVITLDQSDTPD